MRSKIAATRVTQSLLKNIEICYRYVTMAVNAASHLHPTSLHHMP